VYIVYIDELISKLKLSGIGCYIDDTYVGVLGYADDITLLCPSIRSLNKMLHICEVFAKDYLITFNSNKTLCIKFGEPVYSDDVAWINGCIIKWVDNVRHLGNYVSKDLRDDYDCKMKCSAFINSVNKLLANRHRADQRYPSKPT